MSANPKKINWLKLIIEVVKVVASFLIGAELGTTIL